MKSILFLLIKGFSIVLMTGAIGLEFWQFQSAITQSQPPVVPAAVFWVVGFALIAHSIEAVIAAVYAPSKQKSPFSYGIYTFFVGTVGLVELFIPDGEKPIE